MEGVPNLEKSQIIAELRSLLKEAYDKDLDDTAHKIEDFVGKFEVNMETKAGVTGLKKKYPNYFDYELYHVISGSTPTIVPKYFDFPGEDSIEKFIRGL